MTFPIPGQLVCNIECGENRYLGRVNRRYLRRYLSHSGIDKSRKLR